ncbi:MAG TPA: hypothetical protein EYP30_09535 [Archaeoglobaceae archaeon]|nr:hypothetical protein [Archaeoglobaceae archaeon]
MRKLAIAAVIAVVVVVSIGVMNWVQIKPEPKKVDIAYDYVMTQGLAESGMEKVKINGTVWNQGGKEARNLAITALFIDEYYGEIIEKPVRVKENLLPSEQINIHAEYLREKTIPKTEVKEKIRVEWTEDGQRKVRILPPVKSSESAGSVKFKENLRRYDDRFVIEIVPSKKGDYEVIYLFKESGNTRCGDEVFYDASDENPVTLSFPINKTSHVEYHVKIFGLDGMLLHESSASSSVEGVAE